MMMMMICSAAFMYTVGKNSGTVTVNKRVS